MNLEILVNFEKPQIQILDPKHRHLDVFEFSQVTIYLSYFSWIRLRSSTSLGLDIMSNYYHSYF